MEKDKEKNKEIIKENDLFDYLNWRGDIEFTYDGFNKIDGMIFSRLVYAPFEHVFEVGVHNFTIAEACKRMLDYEEIENSVLDQKDIELFKALINSRRYSELVLGHYVNIFDTVEQTQFSAITVHITNEFHVIVFRGTDNTIIGWKEDLNLGFIFPIESQNLALKYLRGIAALTRGTLIVAGHSKGGNLAVYSAAFAPENVQERIVRVYNYDGPGFMDEVLESKGYKQVCDRVRTFVPQGSVIGVLLGHKERHTVIHSLESSMMRQHGLYSWAVSGRNFVKEESTSSQSRYLDNTMKEWFVKMDRDKREMFFETAYSAISELEEKKVVDLKSMDTFKLIYSTYRGMNEESKKVITEGIKLFMSSAKDSFGTNKNESKSQKSKSDDIVIEEVLPE